MRDLVRQHIRRAEQSVVQELRARATGHDVVHAHRKPAATERAIRDDRQVARRGLGLAEALAQYLIHAVRDLRERVVREPEVGREKRLHAHGADRRGDGGRLHVPVTIVRQRQQELGVHASRDDGADAVRDGFRLRHARR